MIMDAIAPARHVLALDQGAAKIGVAIGRAGMTAPLCDTYMVPQSPGSVRDWLDANIKAYHVHHVFYEAPFCGFDRQVFAHVNQLIGIIRLVCDDHFLPCEAVTPGEWRKTFIGVTRAPEDIPKGDRRRQWLKAQALRACAVRHWDVKNDDEAEAAGILDWGLLQLGRKT